MTFELIRQWAEARNLIEGSTPERQLVKLVEEMGELAHAIGKQDHAEFVDAIGDCIVVLTIMAAQWGYQVEDCIASAYDEIKDRRGKMVAGIFQKDAA